jgi:hypothetical protein
MMVFNFKLRTLIIVFIFYFVFLAVSISATDKDNFSITSKSETQLEIKFNLGNWNLEARTENGSEFKTINCNSQNNLYVEETETLPIYSALVAIPDGMEAELITDIKRQQGLSNVNLRNRDAMIQGRGEGDLYPERQIVISEPGQLRDFRVATINVYPFQYNTGSNDLQVIEEANLTLRFIPSRDGYVNPQAGWYSPSFYNIYNAMIINFNNVRDEPIPSFQPVLLVIYHPSTDSIYNSKIAEFTNWKKQKGYIVNSVSTNTTGSTNTSIKAYIQAQFNNQSTRPDIVTLIGDVTGSYHIPTFSETNSGFVSSHGDYTYTLLAGNDNYGDIQIGRISITTTDELVNYVAKVFCYERDINLYNTAWYDKMLLVGDSGTISGISPVYVNQYIHEISQVANPDYSYTELYGPAPSPADINQAINIGVGFFNYRGYIGMSNWTPGSSLINGTKLNHGVFITCATGNFHNTTSTTESYVRLGTESNPQGGITAIGMSTSSTHTGFNNCLACGIFDGIFNWEMRTMGEALLYTKCHLQSIYGASYPVGALFIDRICNLIGDPTVETYVTVPKTFQITCPTSILAGTPSMEITVNNDLNEPIACATVNVFQSSSSLNITGYTNETGRVLINLPTNLTGEISVTVSMHNYKPLMQTVSICGGGLVYHNSVIDDDNNDGSSGNNNQVINAGETIEYKIQLKNSSSSIITSISGFISHTDAYINFGLNNNILFPDAEPGSIITSDTSVTFSVNPACPDNHPVIFTLTLNCSAGSYTIPVQHIIRASNLNYVSYSVLGYNSYLEIGETANLYVSLLNNGSESAAAVYGILRSLHDGVTVNDSLQYFGNIATGEPFTNIDNPFEIYARGSTIDGMLIPMELYLYNSSGYNDVESFYLTIGHPEITDPLGQDSYGYFIYDIGDTGYPYCPEYNWIGIAPDEGGSGTALAISDEGVSGDEGDQVDCDASELVTLPFAFRFYGVNYNEITVVSNGFMAFGETNNFDFRNGRLPGALGPNPMIAAFWDDLSTITGSIYTYNDTDNNYFIIEWFNLRNGFDRTSEETFQIILYDPAYYPTSTGDGPIKIQYKVFNNVDNSSSNTNHGNYCTVGIKDHTGTIGLEYTYNNLYPVAAQPLGNMKALYITTAPIPPTSPFLALTQTVLIDSSENGIVEPNETLDIRLSLCNMSSVTVSDVLVTITETDPWINIIDSTISYGNISGLGSAINTSGLQISVLEGYPENYHATVWVLISAVGYACSDSIVIALRAPELGFGSIAIQDLTGNNNRIFDPGETVSVILPLYNTGGAASYSGSANLVCSTEGITINTAGVSFNSIEAGDSTNLSFEITASEGMTTGTIVSLFFNAVAGVYSASKTGELELSAPLVVIIGNGASNQAYPLDRYYSYSAHEAIYLASEIGTTCYIKSIGFYKASGNDVSNIEAVTIYMKNTTDTSISTGDYSTSYYTQVYSGSFPNNSTSGWMEVNLDTMFEYCGTTNLAILCVKEYQNYTSEFPYWTYSTSLTNRARQAHSDSAAPTLLTQTPNLPNLKLRIFPAAGFLLPPQNLSAISSHQSVKLDWVPPVTGTPLSFIIYRNSEILNSVTSLTYTDTDVINGITYSYFLKAIYNEGESASTDTLYATPNAAAPTNLTVTDTGNGYVKLRWKSTEGFRENSVNTLSDCKTERTISSYRVYRDGNPITLVTSTNYIDCDVINEVNYNYYVTTVYENPSGESSASNAVQATPTANTIIFGTGVSVTGTSTASPINIYYKSLHGQSVYTAAELNAAGVYGPIIISQVGFYIVSLPTYALPNFIIRMKHTTDSNAANWQTETDMLTVYSNSSYMPTAEGHEMLTLNVPFTWNGVDNIVIDTAFSLVQNWTSSGTVQYTAIPDGYRYTWNDNLDQTNVFAGGQTHTQRPNLKMIFQPSSIESPILTILNVTEGILLNWNSVSGATSYSIYASDNAESGFTPIASVISTSYMDTDADPFRFYFVIATNIPAARFIKQE